MKKLLLISLICILVFSLAITSTAKVKLNYWTYPSIQVEGYLPGEFSQMVIDQFEKEYPEVEVKLQIIPWTGGAEKIRLSIASGDPPDILAANIFSIGRYAQDGLLVPFELTEYEENDFFPFVIEACSWYGEVYLWPYFLDVNAMVISKKIARDTGALDLLPFDRPDRTWTADEFKVFLEKVASAGLPGVLGIVMHFGDSTGQHSFIMLMLQGFGAENFVYEDGKYRCTMNSPEAIEGLEYYVDIYKNSPGVFQQGAETMSCFDNGNLWATGKVAVGIASVRQLLVGLEGKNQLFADLDCSMFPVPSKEGVPNIAQISMEAYGIFDNQDEEKAKYARIFVRYFQENAPINLLAAHYNCAPMRKSAILPDVYLKYADNPDIQFYLNELPKFVKDYGIRSPLHSESKELFRIAMQGILVGELTVKEGLDEVANKVNKLLDEYYAEQER